MHICVSLLLIPLQTHAEHGMKIQIISFSVMTMDGVFSWLHKPMKYITRTCVVGIFLMDQWNTPIPWCLHKRFSVTTRLFPQLHYFLFSYSKWALLSKYHNWDKMYCTKLQVDSFEKNFLKNPEFPVVFFWNCSAYVETCISFTVLRRATAVPDVSNLD